jgi:hypothetical protein
MVERYRVMLDAAESAGMDNPEISTIRELLKLAATQKKPFMTCGILDCILHVTGVVVNDARREYVILQCNGEFNATKLARLCAYSAVYIGYLCAD